MSRSVAEVMQDLENLSVEILQIVDPNAANLVNDAIATVTNLLTAKTLTVAQTVSDVDDASEEALKVKFGGG